MCNQLGFFFYSHSGDSKIVGDEAVFRSMFMEWYLWKSPAYAESESPGCHGWQRGQQHPWDVDKRSGWPQVTASKERRDHPPTTEQQQTSAESYCLPVQPANDGLQSCSLYQHQASKIWQVTPESGSKTWHLKTESSTGPPHPKKQQPCHFECCSVIQFVSSQHFKETARPDWPFHERLLCLAWSKSSQASASTFFGASIVKPVQQPLLSPGKFKRGIRAVNVRRNEYNAVFNFLKP